MVFPIVMQGRTVLVQFIESTTCCLLPRNRSIDLDLLLASGTVDSVGAMGCLIQEKKHIKYQSPASILRDEGRQPLECRLCQSGNVLTPKEWDSAPAADISCSCLLLPQVSWFMHFIAMKHERCYCSSKIPTGCSFHLAWLFPCLLTNRAEPQLCDPTLPAFEKVCSRSFLGQPWLSLPWIQLTILLSTWDHSKKTWIQTWLQLSSGLSSLFLIWLSLPPPLLFFSHQSGVGNEDRICILPPARVFLVQISCLWLEQMNLVQEGNGIHRKWIKKNPMANLLTASRTDSTLTLSCLQQ